jgi:hypothetical protein
MPARRPRRDPEDNRGLWHRRFVNRSSLYAGVARAQRNFGDYAASSIKTSVGAGTPSTMPSRFRTPVFKWRSKASQAEGVTSTKLEKMMMYQQAYNAGASSDDATAL